ncbi:MAG TPA: hypothetical protein VGA45_20280, partial [Actinomycetota bacterium]
MQVVDLAGSGEELPGQDPGGVHLAAPEQDPRLDLVGHLRHVLAAVVALPHDEGAGGVHRFVPAAQVQLEGGAQVV